jgi:hypothetical protein
MEQVLHWSAQQFQVDKPKIITPDNPQTYDNFIIPFMGIDKLYNFLQNRYGIYAKGMGYYFSEDELYIYPQFDTDRNKNTTDGIVRIISVPEGSYLGMDCYHAKIDDDLWILSNSNKSMQSLNAVGEENSGNVHVTANTDNQRDRSVVINKDGSVTRDKSSLTVVQMSNKAGAMNASSQNIKYCGQRSNIYQSTSEMAANNGTVLACEWNMAIPRSIKPGQIVTYQYDDTNSGFSSQKGRIMNVEYRAIKQHPHTDGTFILTFSANLTVFIDPEKGSEP